MIFYNNWHFLGYYVTYSIIKNNFFQKKPVKVFVMNVTL